MHKLQSQYHTTTAAAIEPTGKPPIAGVVKVIGNDGKKTNNLKCGRAARKLKNI